MVSPQKHMWNRAYLFILEVLEKACSSIACHVFPYNVKLRPAFFLAMVNTKRIMLSRSYSSYATLSMIVSEEVQNYSSWHKDNYKFNTANISSLVILTLRTLNRQIQRTRRTEVKLRQCWPSPRQQTCQISNRIPWWIQAYIHLYFKCLIKVSFSHETEG